jgi:sodium-independent sulfate anion transporter 11
LEFLIWLAAVLITIFSSIENGIYTSIAASGFLLLVRIAHPRGSFLGKATVRESSGDKSQREVFLPLDKRGVTHHDLKVTPPSPGVLVYRFEESYLYPNASIVNSVLVDYVKENLRRGRDMTHVKLSDRPWNDPGSRGGAAQDQINNEKKPVLHAIVLDFSTV